MGSSGTLPSDWRALSMHEIASVRFSGVDKKSLEDETPVRLCNYMEVWKNPYIHDDMPFMEATATDREIDQFSLKLNDVLLTKDSETKDEIAQPSVVQEELNGVVLGYHLALLRPNPKKAYGPFLAAQLTVPRFRRHFVRVASGATRYGLGIEEVRKAVLWLPDIAEQKAISGILRSIDTAIERTRAVIEQVRVVKEALLADLMTNGLPGRHKKFKTVKGLGRIPAKWCVVLFEEAIKRITYGFTNPMPTTNEGPYMVTAKNVEDGYINYAETRHTDWDDYRTLLSDKSRPSIDDVLLTKDGTLGRVALVDRDNVCVNQSVAVITPLPSALSPTFLYWMLQSRPWQEALTRDASGSGLQHIYITKVAKLRVGLPQQAEQAKISQAMGKAEARHVNEREYLDCLIRSKSALSDALLTGKVRVPSAIEEIT